MNKDKSPVSFYGVTANNVADNFGELFIGEKPEGQFPSEIVWTDSVGRAQLAVSILCPLPGTVSWKNTGREKLMEEIREYGVTQEDDSFCCDDLLNELDRLSLNIENFIILIQKRWRGFLIRKYLISLPVGKNKKLTCLDIWGRPLFKNKLTNRQQFLYSLKLKEHPCYKDKVWDPYNEKFITMFLSPQDTILDDYVTVGPARAGPI